MLVKEIQKLLKEIKKMFQQILDLLTRINAALDAIANSVITPGQAQQIIAGLTSTAQKAEALAGTSSTSVSSIAPNPATVGGQVTIAGTGFGATQGSGGVSFNGVAGTVVQWADQSIVAAVPVGATTGQAVVTTGSGRVASQLLTIS